ncbi:TPA: hypothetical protein ACH3X1_014329 [Trebouxia sp. C0004]
MEVCSSYSYTYVVCSSYRMTEGPVSLQLYPYRFALHTVTPMEICPSHSYADFLFIQVCSEPAPMHSSTAQGKTSSPVFSAALQNRLTACTVSLCLHLCRFALHTGAPMQISSSYRCAVNQHPRTAALLRAKRAPQCSVLLCKTGSQLALCPCRCTYADFLFIQVCSEPAAMHSSTAQGKTTSPVFSAALQNRLTACTVSLCLHLCRFALHTDVQRTSTNALQHCPGQVELPVFRAALQNSLTACTMSL